MPAKKFKTTAEAHRIWKQNNRERWSREDPHTIPGLRHCPTCDRDLPRTTFAIARSNKDGLQWKCNDCIFTRHASDPRNRMLSNAKTRARRKGLEFDLEISDIEIPEVCPVFGTPLETIRGHQRLRKAGETTAPNTPTIDRIDNSKGYIKGNVRVISWRANNIKSDCTASELETVLAYMKNYRPADRTAPVDESIRFVST